MSKSAIHSALVVAGLLILPACSFGQTVPPVPTGEAAPIVVPGAMIEQVLETATGIEHAEQGIMEAVKSGLSIGEARKKFGYHSLQTKT